MDASEAMAALTEIAVGLALGFMLEGTGLIAGLGEQARLQPISHTAYDSAAWKDIVGHLAAELARLPAREQAILRHHYLEGIGFDHLAALLDISRARVSQLHRAALAILRKRMAARGHFRLER